MSIEVKLTARTPLFPTESIENVKTALLNIVNVEDENVHIEEIGEIKLILIKFVV